MAAILDFFQNARKVIFFVPYLQNMMLREVIKQFDSFGNI